MTTPTSDGVRARIRKFLEGGTVVRTGGVFTPDGQTVKLASDDALEAKLQRLILSEGFVDGIEALIESEAVARSKADRLALLEELGREKMDEYSGTEEYREGFNDVVEGINAKLTTIRDQLEQEK